jgi:hypothetical protein
MTDDEVWIPTAVHQPKPMRVQDPDGTVHEFNMLEPPAWCLCGYVDDRGDGTCGNCGLRIMSDDEAAASTPTTPSSTLNGD